VHAPSAAALAAAAAVCCRSNSRLLDGNMQLLLLSVFDCHAWQLFGHIVTGGFQMKHPISSYLNSPLHVQAALYEVLPAAVSLAPASRRIRLTACVSACRQQM
jgi:hypothetical protein